MSKRTDIGDADTDTPQMSLPQLIDPALGTRWAHLMSRQRLAAESIATAWVIF